MQKSSALYLLILVLAIGLVVSAAGGGLFGQQRPWLLQWQHQLFYSLCHQIPERSLWINGQPMAVCSRCFGIYSAFALGWCLLPWMPDWNESPLFFGKYVLLGAVLLNVADLVGNLAGFWENTLTSRLVLGCLVGLTAAGLFAGTFFNRNIKSERDHHGRITTTGI